MAEISKIKLPSGDVYDIKDSRLGNAKIFYGTCNTAAATVAKVVTCADFTSSDLVKGALIFVKFNYTNSGAVANLTLNVNGTGAKPIKRQWTTTGSSNLLAAGELVADSTYLFQYNGTNWICMTLDYTNSYTLYNLPEGAGNYKTSSALYRYELLFQQDEDTFTPLNTVSNGYNSVSKTILTNVEFDPFGRIYYYASTSDVSANGYINAANLCYHYGVDLRYTFNISTTVNALTTNENVYLKVSPQSNGKVKLASATPLVQDLPATNDGYYYIFLGRAYSTYQMILYTEHPVYYHNGKEVMELLNPKIGNNYAPAPIKGGVCGGSTSGVKWGKIFEYCFDQSGTLDSASTFLFTQYVTSGTGYSAQLLINVRSDNKNTDPQYISANWTNITSDFSRDHIIVTWCRENEKFYIRIYGRAYGWSRTTCGVLLNQHAWTTEEKDHKGTWTGYSGILGTNENEVTAFDNIPSTETTVTIGLKKLVADGFVKNGGTSSQFLKADGSVDTDVQKKLVSGTNIKTINGNSILTSGNLNLLDANKRYQMPTNPFGGSDTAIHQNLTNDGFYSADQRFTVTLTGFTNNTSVTAAKLFDGNYETNAEIATGGTGVILIESNTPLFGTYNYGFTYLSFYYTGVPQSASMRIYGTKSGVEGWYDAGSSTYYYGTSDSTTNVVLQLYNSSVYNAKKFEITIVAKSDIACKVTQIDHMFTRGSSNYMSAVTKFPVKQDLWGDIEAPSFIKRGGTSSQFLKADGSVDSNTYVTSSAIATMTQNEVDTLVNTIFS